LLFKLESNSFLSSFGLGSLFFDLVLPLETDAISKVSAESLSFLFSDEFGFKLLESKSTGGNMISLLGFFESFCCLVSWIGFETSGDFLTDFILGSIVFFFWSFFWVFFDWRSWDIGIISDFFISEKEQSVRPSRSIKKCEFYDDGHFENIKKEIRMKKREDELKKQILKEEENLKRELLEKQKQIELKQLKKIKKK